MTPLTESSDPADYGQHLSGFIMQGLKNKTVIIDGLGAGQICRIYKGLALKANLSPQVIEDISGHAMRFGGAQDHLLQGATIPQLMIKGG